MPARPTRYIKPVCLLASAALILFIIALSRRSHIPPLKLPVITQENHPVDMDFRIGNDDVPGSAMVYRFKPEDSAEELVKIAAMFGYQDNQFARHAQDGRISYKLLKEDMSIYYRVGMSWDYQDYTRSKISHPEVPDETESLRIASEFLEEKMALDPAQFSISYGGSYRGGGKEDPDSVELAYWSDPADIREQPYLQPIYAFTGTQTLDNGETKPVSTIIPALK